MQNSVNTRVGRNLVTNSPYLLVPNPFYKNGSDFNLPGQANPPDSINGNLPYSNQAPHPSNLNPVEGSGTIFNTILEMLGSPPQLLKMYPLNPSMVEVVGNVRVKEAQNVGNPLITSMVEIVKNVEVEETENVGNPLNLPMIEVVGNVGVGSLLLKNPSMVKAENVGNPPMEFHPKDLRLITHFLTRRVRNEPLEESTIHEINFYDYPPQYLADNYAHGVPRILFFFTPKRHLYQQKAVRKVNGEGGGSWCRVSGHVKWIKDDGNRVVGSVKSFKFAPKNPNPNDITWLMKEYNLPNEEPQHESENVHEYVLVKLHSN